MSGASERTPMFRQRRALDDQIPGTRDNLLRFITGDTRWKELPRYFQILVIQTAKAVQQLTSEEVLERARRLDEETPQSPYLRDVTERYGTLMYLHTATAATFDEDDVFPTPIELYPKMLAKQTQLRVAERLMGRTIEQFYTWKPGEGFVGIPNETRYAMDLCVDALAHSPSNF